MSIATRERTVVDAVEPRLYVGGHWVDASGGGTLPVEDPATGETLREVADATVEDARAALDAVAEHSLWASQEQLETFLADVYEARRRD